MVTRLRKVLAPFKCVGECINTCFSLYFLQITIIQKMLLPQPYPWGGGGGGGASLSSQLGEQRDCPKSRKSCTKTRNNEEKSACHDELCPQKKFCPGGRLILYKTCHRMPGNVTWNWTADLSFVTQSLHSWPHVVRSFTCLSAIIQAFARLQSYCAQKFSWQHYQI